VTRQRASPGSSTISPTDLPLLLQSSINAAAEHMHGERSVPAKLLSELRDAGAFSLFTPRELGGFEVPLTTALKVYEGFGRVDASVAWVVWSGNLGFLAALLDESGVERIWTAGAQPVFANSGMPGVATPVDGGYHVSGHWKIVSGVNSAEWLVVVAIVEQDGVPRRTAEGAVDVRLFLLRPDQLEVRDTWQVSGMRGSGSNDVLADNALVPSDLVVRFDLPARIQRPLYQGFVPALVFPGSTAIALGVAQAAIDEAVRLATTKMTPRRCRTRRGRACPGDHRRGGCRRCGCKTTTALLRRSHGCSSGYGGHHRAASRAAGSHESRCKSVPRRAGGLVRTWQLIVAL
jgi:alkylation response protein AidB-like acyl-CoA dehydrogenase